jgi:excisionase family DNA binding protein
LIPHKKSGCACVIVIENRQSQDCIFQQTVYNNGMSLTSSLHPVLDKGILNTDILPTVCELTVAQAAAVLDVPVGYVDELLEDNLIEYRQEGNRRFIDYDDLFAYKERRERSDAEFAELMNMFQEMGLSHD